jgi:hypothetical protein
MGPFVVKSPLQASPFLVLAGVAPFVARERARLRVLLVPAGALLASLALRANLPLAYALGFPFLHLRYVIPAIALLVVAAVAVLRDVGTSKHAVAVGVAVALGAGFALARGDDDFSLLRRLFLLDGTLVLAALAAFLVLRRRSSAARLAVAAALGIGLAVNVAVDGRALAALRRDLDARVDAVARLTPQRFALLGGPDEIDPVLALRASREVEYLDFYEVADWADARRIVDHWTQAGIPVFLLWKRGWAIDIPWPDARWEPVEPAIALFKWSP